MDKFPGNNPNWLAALNSDDEDSTPIAGDPYYPIRLGDTSEEEEPSEDEGPENNDDGILVEVPRVEGIFEDAQTDGELEESLTDEEVVPLPPYPVATDYEPYPHRGKGLTMRRTPRISVRTQPNVGSLLDGTVCGHGRLSDLPRSLPDITPFLTQTICGHKRKALDCPAHYEVGESSRAPPPIAEYSPTSPPIAEYSPASPPIAEYSPASPPIAEYSPASPPVVEYSPASPPVVEISPAPPPDGESSRAPPTVDESSQALPSIIAALQAQMVRLTNHIGSLEVHIRNTNTATEHRVERLEGQGRTDGSAIQTLYHRVGAGRTEAIAIGTRLQTSAYETQILRTRLTLAERQVTDLRYELNQLREQFDEVVRYLTDRA